MAGTRETEQSCGKRREPDVKRRRPAGGCRRARRGTGKGAAPCATCEEGGMCFLLVRVCFGCLGRSMT